MKYFLKNILLIFFIIWIASCTSPNNSPTPSPLLPSSISSSSLHFFTFGDWGTGDDHQKQVAELTQKICAQSRCDFGLLLGDNFYETGVASTDDPQWKTKYQDMYTAYPSLKIPMFVALGNHDWAGNPQAQVDYSQKDPYWKMPAFNFSFHYPTLSKTKPLVEIFVLNSNQLDEAAQTWLKKSLNESPAVWKLLAFHHPILNNGVEHPSDQMNLWPKLKPIVCGKIDLILSGHEHLFSHLQGEVEGCKVEQVIVGTGGKRLYAPLANPPPAIQVLSTISQFGVGFFEVSAKEITLHFYLTTGQEAYSYTWKKS